MDRITMKGVADLAGVSRQAVTVWRRRCASTDTPFPEPLQDNTFRVDDVVAWLDATGRGAQCGGPRRSGPPLHAPSPRYAERVDR